MVSSAGKGKLYVRWEPTEQPMDGPEDKGWVAVGEGFLSWRVEHEPMEGPNNGMWRTFVGSVLREVSFSLAPPTGPITVTLDPDETTPEAEKFRRAAMRMIFGKDA